MEVTYAFNRFISDQMQAGRDALRILSESCIPCCEAKGSSRKGLECRRIRILWRMLALTVASSPYSKGPTKLIETQGMNS